MIFDQLKNADTYGSLGPRFTAGFDYLRDFDPATPDGRYEIQGDQLYALVQSYDSADPAQRTFESHRDYADIQFILSGRETIFYCRSDQLEAKEGYDEAKDVIFYHDNRQQERAICLAAGEFAVLWPQDGHKPGCAWGQSQAVRKIVLKVRLGALSDYLRKKMPGASNTAEQGVPGSLTGASPARALL